MDRPLDMLTLLLLDPCLTADEAAREAAARTHAAAVICETRPATDPRNRKLRQAAQIPAIDGPAVGF